MAARDLTPPWRLALGLLGAGAVVACLAARGGAVLDAGPTDFDDAFMYVRYAHNLLAGATRGAARDTASITFRGTF